MKPNELTKRPGFGTNNPWGGKVGQWQGCVSWENCRVYSKDNLYKVRVCSLYRVGAGHNKTVGQRSKKRTRR